MVSSHEGTIGRADCAVAVRAIQNWEVGVYAGTELVRKKWRISHEKRKNERERIAVGWQNSSWGLCFRWLAAQEVILTNLGG